ncbi:hypothetical protein IE81DRAFT_344952 [Ceraceosorus guamensis]|uniref:Zn(2)-C6 fungal-type domain-containing protein n=1 Tax=Ceraceosorus guamensis TaxID=1522189 RepID=A0A316WBF9_9BASI|nr:hypothetical protein IE81DRAFT_344952 [Ceraceosorus guamensis]PWN45263.1 hypothetical protein IE81DRAFT_344952 [Ceraceosorus guamensis]
MGTPSRWDQNSRGARAPYSTSRYAAGSSEQVAPPPSLPSAAAADRRGGKPPNLSMSLPSDAFSALAAPQAPDLPVPPHPQDAQLHSFLPHSGPEWTRDDAKASLSSSSGAGTHRKQKFQRSRTGCLICRRRKVKCSQDGLPCKQCRIGNRDCHYDESQPKQPSKRRGSVGSSSYSGNKRERQRDADRRRSLQSDVAPPPPPPAPPPPRPPPPLQAALDHTLQDPSTFRGLSIPPFVQSTFAQHPMSQNAASYAGSFHDPRPAGGIPSNPFNSSGFVTNTHDPAAGMRYSSFAGHSNQPSAGSVAEWQQSVQWPSAPTYPPLPSLHGQEDASPALDPRINPSR